MTAPHIPPEAVPLPGALETTLALITAMVAGDDATLRQLLREATTNAQGVVPLLAGLVSALLAQAAENESLTPLEAWQQRAVRLTSAYMAGD